MKNKWKIKWFTFIEIIISLSIIILLSGTSIYYFDSFSKKQKLEFDIEKLEDDIKYLDSKVKNREILDYELDIKKDSYFYAYSYNKKINTYYQDLDIIWAFSWEIKTNDLLGWKVWAVKIYKNNKISEEIYLDSKETYPIDIWENKEISIYSYISWSYINPIEIKNLSLNDLLEENLTNIYEINTKEDKSWTDLDNIIIKNINNIKKIEDQDWNKLETVYLFFEKNSIEKSLKL